MRAYDRNRRRGSYLLVKGFDPSLASECQAGGQSIYSFTSQSDKTILHRHFAVFRLPMVLDQHVNTIRQNAQKAHPTNVRSCSSNPDGSPIANQVKHVSTIHSTFHDADDGDAPAWWSLLRFSSVTASARLYNGIRLPVPPLSNVLGLVVDVVRGLVSGDLAEPINVSSSIFFPRVFSGCVVFACCAIFVYGFCVVYLASCIVFFCIV